MFRPWRLYVQLPLAFLQAHCIGFDEVNRAVAAATVISEQAAATHTISDAVTSGVGSCRKCLAAGTGGGTLEQRRKGVLHIPTPFVGAPQLVMEAETEAVEFVFEGCRSLCPSTIAHWGYRLCLVVSKIRGVVLVSAPFVLRSRWKGRLPPAEQVSDASLGYALVVSHPALLTPPERPLTMPAFFVAVLCATNLNNDGASLVNAHLTAMFSQLPGFVGHNMHWQPQLLLGVGQYRNTTSALTSISLGETYVEAANPWHTNLRSQGAIVILTVCNSW